MDRKTVTNEHATYDQKHTTGNLRHRRRDIQAINHKDIGYESLLGDGPSQRHLCDLCKDAWVRALPVAEKLPALAGSATKVTTTVTPNTQSSHGLDLLVRESDTQPSPVQQSNDAEQGQEEG